MFVRFIGETETWVCFGFCVCLSMPGGGSKDSSLRPAEMATGDYDRYLPTDYRQVWLGGKLFAHRPAAGNEWTPKKKNELSAGENSPR